MAIKELQTRIALKYDSYANWTNETVEGKGAKLVLLPGELGICYIGDTNQESNVVPTVLFKVGDGTKTFKQLPWASAKAADVYSWAKASEVKRVGKELVFVGGNVDGTDKKVAFDYVTLEEVQAITNGLDSRITALEGKFSGDNNVQGQIDALDGRLDVIEGDGAGSVKKALADAKAYTDEREVEINKYADQAEADAKAYADTELAKDRSRITANENAISTINGDAAGSIKKAAADALASAQSYADQAELDAVATAKGYTDTREAAIKTAYEAYADQAEADAKNYVDDEVEALEAEDLRLAGLIGGNTTAIGNEVTARENADKAINDKIGGSFDSTNTVAKAISDAQSNAISAAASDAATKVKALEDGKVATNAAAITAMDTAYKAADTALGNRITAVEGKLADVSNVMDFRGAVAELPASTEGYQNGDVIVVTGGEKSGREFVVSDGEFVEFGYADGNTAAIESLQGRMTTAEGDIDDLETRAGKLEAADTAIGQRIDALVGDNGTIATGDAATLAAAKSYAEEKASAAESAAKSHAESKASAAQSAAEATAKSYTDTEVNKLSAKDTEIAGKVTTLQNIVDGYTDKGSIKSAIEAAAAKGQTGIDDAATAQAAAEAAQGTADTVKAAVENATTGLAATKGIADKAASDLAALTTRVGTAEGDIDALEAIVNDASKGNEKLRTDVNALQTLTGENGAIRQEIAAAKKAGDDAAQAVTYLTNGQVKTNKEDISKLDGRVTAIENDYLKAADVYIFNCGSSTLVTHEAPKAE